jgi:hypothetical protein
MNWQGFGGQWSWQIEAQFWNLLLRLKKTTKRVLCRSSKQEIDLQMCETA